MAILPVHHRKGAQRALVIEIETGPDLSNALNGDYFIDGVISYE